MSLSKSSANNVVNIVFVPIYAILALFAVFVLYRSVTDRVLTLKQSISNNFRLILWGLVKLVGNILLIVAVYSQNPSTGLIVGGYICQALGFGILIAVGLMHYKTLVPGKTKWVRAFEILILIAIIMLSVGSSNADVAGAVSSANKISLPAETKVGALLFLICLAILVFLLVTYLSQTRSQGIQGAPVILTYQLLAACVFMAIRAIYGLVLVFRGNLFAGNETERIILYISAEAVGALLLNIAALTAIKVTREQNVRAGEKDAELGEPAQEMNLPAYEQRSG